MADTPASMIQPLIGIFICLCVAYGFIIHPFFYHPLRKIPSAHWTVPFPYLGYLWILYQRYRSRNNATTYTAHLKHGPIVRLGYNELSVNCVDNGIRTIYGGGWEKHDWYPRQFPSYGVINMFSTVHHTPHSQKKRTIANIYSKSNLQISAQLKMNSVHLLTTRFLPLLQSLSENGEIAEVHEMNNAFTMDFMSAYLYGIGNSTNFTHDIASRKKFLHLYHSRRQYDWYWSELPPRLLGYIEKLRIPLIPAWISDAEDGINDWNADMCKRADQYLVEQPVTTPEKAGDEPVVFKYFKNGIEKLRVKDPEAGREFLPHILDPTPLIRLNDNFATMTRNEVKSDMMDQLGAGHETSAIGLTYLYWELSRNPSMQERLHKEMKALQPQIKWPPSTNLTEVKYELPEPKVIDGLRYLHAVLMETLRLHAPIPGMEPRVSPYVAGGSKLGAYSGIPGGVRVSSMPYTLHRNPEVFKNPETFDPDRWLIDDEARLKEMHRWFWAFGSGGRMCIGSHLAVQEMKLIVASLYTNWKTEIVDDDGIEEVDTYTTRPTSNKLMLRFVHR